MRKWIIKLYLKQIERLKVEIKSIAKKIGTEKVRSEPIVWSYYLLEFFNYNVTKGGFLEDIEKMLRQVNAKLAFDYYVQAIEICLANSDKYQKFVSGNYIDENIVKNKLHLVSINYFGEKIDFADEIGSFINDNLSEVIDRIKYLSEN